MSTLFNKSRWFLLFGALIFAACENEVDLTADWKDVPVVYGLLDRQDTTYFIRVEKAFQDENGSAFAAAANPDSLYYPPEVVVRLENVTTGQSAVMERVNGEDYGLPRDNGEFAQSPNILYRLPAGQLPFEGGQRARLSIERGDNLPLVTGEATVIGEIVPLNSLNTGMELAIPGDRDVSFRWRAATGAKIYDLNLFFNYAEENLSNPGQFEFKSLKWEIAKGIISSGEAQEIYRVFGLDFYSYLADAIPSNPNVRRYFQTIDAQVLAGGEAPTALMGLRSER